MGNFNVQIRLQTILLTGRPHTTLTLISQPEIISHSTSVSSPHSPYKKSKSLISGGFPEIGVYSLFRL